MSDKNNPRKFQSRLPAAGFGLVGIFLGISLLFHLLSLVSLPDYRSLVEEKAREARNRKPVKITLIEKEKQKEKEKPKPSDEKKPELPENRDHDKDIVEVIQKPTEKKPDPARSRLGYTTHHTEKETRIIPDNITSGQDPARADQKVKSKTDNKIAGVPDPEQAKRTGPKKDAREEEKGERPRVQILSDPTSDFRIKATNPRNNYEKILSQSMAMLGNEVSSGYQDYIDDEVQVGDSIDLNTQEYRYIGYFTNLRKAIELACVYPANAARKGMYGNVYFKFTIHKDGQASQVQVLDSSGHKILDHAVVEAVRLAAPFAPLPHDFGKKINIQGTFRFILR